jgi:hypothetical protein
MQIVIRFSTLRRILPYLLSIENCAFQRTPGRLRAQRPGAEEDKRRKDVARMAD